MRENIQEKKQSQTAQIINKIIDLSQLKPEDYAVPGGWADQIAKENKKVKTAQLRKFFNAIKKLHLETRGTKDIKKVKTETVKLIPQLIFAKGRDVITQEFYNLLEACLLKEKDRKKVSRFEKYEEFENFVSFLEAIVAYHKYNEKTRGGQSE